MTLVTFENVYKYDIKKPYNLVIKEGDFVIINGVNGSGKTTLIRLILGFIKPDKGRIKRKRLKISYLPEKVQLPYFMKGITYLECLTKMKKVNFNMELMRLFDIPLFRYVHQLSKGNIQKIAIISTFIGHADMILMDEPLSGLDQQSIITLINYLKKLYSMKQTMIIATHQPERFIDFKPTVFTL